MARKKSGGTLGTIIWIFFILSCIFAWTKTPVPAGTDGIASFAEAKSKSVEAWVKDMTKGGTSFDVGRLFKGSNGLVIEIDGKFKELGNKKDTNNGSSNNSGIDFTNKKVNASQSLKDLDKIKTGSNTIKYDRGEWKHWITSGSNSCWNVREEVLDKEAVKGSIVYLDSSKKVTTNKGKACSIKSGKWNDPYTGKTFTDPAKLDIDHMIPLSYTAKHGGQAWDSKKKQDYANDMGYENHLIAVEAGANRQKGDKGPGVWKPSNKSYHCTYAASWTTIATKWKLSLDKEDVTAMRSMLKTC